MKDSREPKNYNEFSRRAAGRRAYNARRWCLRERRQVLVAELLCRLGGDYGVQAKIARVLKVSEATVSRDIKALHKQWRQESFGG